MRFVWFWMEPNRRRNGRIGVLTSVKWQLEASLEAITDIVGMLSPLRVFAVPLLLENLESS